MVSPRVFQVSTVIAPGPGVGVPVPIAPREAMTATLTTTNASVTIASPAKNPRAGRTTSRQERQQNDRDERDRCRGPAHRDDLRDAGGLLEADELRPSEDPERGRNEEHDDRARILPIMTP